MYELKILDERSSGDWDALVEEAAGGTIFQKSAWLQLCERYHGARLVRLGFFQNGKLLAALPLFIRRFGPFRVACSPLVVEDTPYMGPALAAGASLERVWDSFDAYAARAGLNFLRVLMSTRPDERLFEARGYKAIVRHTHILDLAQGEEAIWKRMEGRCRTAIRKADKSGVEVSFREGSGFIDKYYSLAEGLYHRQNKIVPNPRGFYADIFSEPLKENARLAVASLEGREIAAAILLYYKKTVYYLDAVSANEYNSFCPNNAIQWYIIRSAVQEGYEKYDFVGSDLPWIAKFKAGFGGTLCEYLLLEKARPRFLFALRSAYGSKLKPWLNALRARASRRGGAGPEEAGNG